MSNAHQQRAWIFEYISKDMYMATKYRSLNDVIAHMNSVQGATKYTELACSLAGTLPLEWDQGGAKRVVRECDTERYICLRHGERVCWNDEERGGGASAPDRMVDTNAYTSAF